MLVGLVTGFFAGATWNILHSPVPPVASDFESASRSSSGTRLSITAKGGSSPVKVQVSEEAYEKGVHAVTERPNDLLGRINMIGRIPPRFEMVRERPGQGNCLGRDAQGRRGQRRAISSIAENFVQGNPAAAVEWATGIESTELQEIATKEATRKWVESNPAGAANYALSSIPSGDLQRTDLGAPRTPKKRKQPLRTHSVLIMSYSQHAKKTFQASDPKNFRTAFSRYEKI